jgi:DNA-directed RNA polymerase specialized sigma subunit
LIAKAKNGDTEAAVQVVDRFAPLVRKHSRRLGYAEAASDLTIWLIEAIHRYQPNHIREQEEVEKFF